MRFQNNFASVVLALAAGTVAAQTPPTPQVPRPFAPSAGKVGESAPGQELDTKVINPRSKVSAPTTIESPLAAPGNGCPSFPLHDCVPESCTNCDPCCLPVPRAWIGADYLLWWMKNGNVPVLVTTGPASSSGIIGQPGTTTLFGGSAIDQGAFSGVRINAGFWLDECKTIGLEGNYFTLGSRSVNYTAGNNGAPGSPVVSRPFFNANTGREDAELVAFPGVLAGTVQANVSSRLDGAELNGLYNICCAPCSRVDLLAGFRYLDLNDGVTVVEDLAVLPSVAGSGGNRFHLVDEFHARSQLYAGQVGARAVVRRGKWDATFTGKLALGSTHEEVRINGSTVLTSAQGVTTVTSGGLLALPSNIGVYKRDVFAVVPEFNFGLSYQLTQSLRASVGYDFLYWSNVVRAGDQIDRVLNPNQIPSAQSTGAPARGTRPAFAFHDSDFWAQGLTFSLELRY